jgi:hypothetical protein
MEELSQLQFNPRGLVQGTVRVESRDLQHVLTETGRTLAHLQERYTVLEENQKVLEENQRMLLAENRRLREQLEKPKAAGAADLLVQLLELSPSDVEAAAAQASAQKVALLHRAPAFTFLIKRFNNMVDNFNLLNGKLSQVEGAVNGLGAAGSSSAAMSHVQAHKAEAPSAEEDSARHHIPASREVSLPRTATEDSAAGDAAESERRSRRPYLGLEISDNPDMDGLKVVSIKPDSPAARAGLLTGDSLLTFNDVELTNREAFRALIRTAALGQAAPILFLRMTNGKPLRMKSTIVIGAQDAETEKAMIQHDERGRVNSGAYMFIPPTTHHRLLY